MDVDIESGRRPEAASSESPSISMTNPESPTGSAKQNISSIVVTDVTDNRLNTLSSSVPLISQSQRLSTSIPDQSASSYTTPFNFTFHAPLSTTNSLPYQSGLASDTTSLHFPIPQTMSLLSPFRFYSASPRKRTRENEEEHTDRVRVIQLEPRIESTKQLANQQARTSISKTIGEQYNRKAEQLTQEAKKFVEEANKHAEEVARRAVEEAKQFIEEANRRAEEANRRAEEAIQETKEAKELFIAELEKRKLAEENRAKEMADVISAAQTRAQAAEQKTLEASKIAEEKIQKTVQEALKLQETFAEAMKRFNMDPIRKISDQGEQCEAIPDIISMDSDSDDLDQPAMSRIPDNVEQMSRATLPPSSDDEEQEDGAPVPVGHSNFKDMKGRKRVLISKTPEIITGIVHEEMEADEEMVIDAPNANNRGKQRQESQDPRVPFPRKFRPPRGGQHRITIRVNDPAPNTSQISNKEAPNNTASTSTGTPTPKSNLHIGNKPEVNRPASSKGIFRLDATEENQEPNRRRRQKKKRLFFHHTRLRGSDEARTENLKEVRNLMNELMHINKDKEIEFVESATVDEVLGYQEGTNKGPTLDPMLAFLNRTKRTGPESVAAKIWNIDLAELFVDYFEGENEMNLSADDRVFVGGLFLDRLNRLARKWQECQELSKGEREAKEAKYLKGQRANSRRVELYDTRWSICHGNLKNRDGTDDLGWKATLKMIEKLQAAGMSSDESERDETTGQITYIIKKRAWRSREVLDRLKLIDKDKNTTNAYGGARAGNQPRIRRRVPIARESTRAAVPDCPENFYAQEFIANITSELVLDQLNKQTAVNLGNFQDE